MNYKVKTTLKRADTEGRIPAYTLDQYVRTELANQLIDRVQQQLHIDRSVPHNSPEMVDFVSEIVVFESFQWQQLKEKVLSIMHLLSSEQKSDIQQYIDAVEGSN